MATENNEYVCEKLVTDYSAIACTCSVHTNRSKYRGK